jgi:hypothetical protein
MRYQHRQICLSEIISDGESESRVQVPKSSHRRSVSLQEMISLSGLSQSIFPHIPQNKEHLSNRSEMMNPIPENLHTVMTQIAIWPPSCTERPVKYRGLLGYETRAGLGIERIRTIHSEDKPMQTQ